MNTSHELASILENDVEPDQLAALTQHDHLLTDDEKWWRARARQVADELRPPVEEDFEGAIYRSEQLKTLARGGLFAMKSVRAERPASAVSVGLAAAEVEAVDSGYRTMMSVHSSLAGSALAKFGSAEQHAVWTERMESGEALGCFALTEPHGGSDPGAMRTYARRSGSDWVLSGRKRWIGLANHADVAVTWAQTDEGVRGFLVDTTASGFEATPIGGKHSMRTSVQCDVVYDGVRVSGNDILPGAEGLRAPLTCLSEARYGIAWGVLGAARDCIETVLEFLPERHSFGESLAQKQLIQARLADMFVAYQTSLLLALHIGRLKDAGMLRPEHISVAKLNNVRQAQEIARSARHILGGNGITSEYPVMRHMANLESVATYEGTSDVHQLIIGRALTGANAF